MSKIPKTMMLPMPESLEGLRDSPNFKNDLIDWLRSLIDMLQRNHREIRDYAEAGGFATENWRAKEVGDNLEFQKKISGTFTKKGGVTG